MTNWQTGVTGGLLALSLASPAMASEPTLEPLKLAQTSLSATPIELTQAQAPGKNPWIATGITALSPLTFWFYPAPTIAGYWYAGDPVRGAWVGLGIVPTVFASMLIGFAINPDTNADPSGWVEGFWVGYIGYTLWSLYDVYQTTERKNEEARKAALQPTPAP